MGKVIPIKYTLKSSSVFQGKKLVPYLLVSPYLLFVLVFVLFPVLFCFFLTVLAGCSNDNNDPSSTKTNFIKTIFDSGIDEGPAWAETN